MKYSCLSTDENDLVCFFKRIEFYINGGTFTWIWEVLWYSKTFKHNTSKKKTLKVWQPFMLCFGLQCYVCVLILMKVTTYFPIFLCHKNSFCTLQDTLFIKYFPTWFSLINLIHPVSNLLLKCESNTFQLKSKPRLFFAMTGAKQCKRSKIKSGTKIEVLFGEFSLA